MDKKVIKIFDSREIPHGVLSNNYEYNLQIDNINYKSVSNYIYSNMLSEKIHKDVIKKSKPYEISKTYKELYEEETKNVIKEAVLEGLERKFMDSRYSRILLNTGNANILYNSPNTFLGIGNDGNGENIYGKYLLQVRNSLKISDKKQEKEKKQKELNRLLYDIFLAKEGLLKVMKKENNDLKEFLEMSPTEIVDNIGRDKLIEENIPKKDVIDIVTKNDSLNIKKFLNNPKNLVEEVRKEELKYLRIRMISQLKTEIFNNFTEYILSKHYSNLDKENYEKAKEQYFSSIPYNDQMKMKDDLYQLYLDDKLPSVVYENIETEEKNIPSSEEIEEVKQKKLSYNDNPFLFIENIDYKIDENIEPVYINPMRQENMSELDKYYSFLSPLNMDFIIISNKYVFPTISHYIVVKLLTHIFKENNIDIAYDYIKTNAFPSDPNKIDISSFMTPDVASQEYQRVKNITESNMLKALAKKALEKKFKGEMFKNILVLLNNYKLIWNDFSDGILGVGDNGNGENFVGKYLMELRSKFNKDSKEKKVVVDKNNIFNILEKDEYLQNLIKTRTNDICDVLIFMKEYVKEVEDTDITFDPSFIKNVVLNIYSNCFNIFDNISEIENKTPPQYFKKIIKDRLGQNILTNSVKLLWKYAFSVIYYFVSNFKGVLYLDELKRNHIKSILSISTLKNTNCKRIYGIDKDDCIISALVNILNNIVKFNKSMYIGHKLSEIDVYIAASILIKANILLKMKKQKGTTFIEKQQKSDEKESEKSDEESDEESDESDEEQEIEQEQSQDYDEEEIEEQSQQDYDEEELSEYESDDDEEIIYNAPPTMLSKQGNIVLKDLKNIKNPQKLFNAILEVLKIIKSHHNIEQLKNIRINFFSKIL